MVTRILKAVVKRNQWLIDRMRFALGDSEPVTLERQVRGKRSYYYSVERVDGKRRRKYLGNGDAGPVRRVLGNAARRIRIGILERNNRKILEAIDCLEDDTVEAVLRRLKPLYRKIAEECFLDERMEALKAWAAEDYIRNPADFPEQVHRAWDGTRLRSKGEVIWYNTLYMLGIPFRYDCRIIVVDQWGRKRYEYPDFLIQCYDGSYIIIEHLGKLKEDDYLKRQADKIRNYLLSGYVLGVNFFVTSDDAVGGTDSEAIRRMAWQVQELFYGEGVPSYEEFGAYEYLLAD